MNDKQFKRHALKLLLAWLALLALMFTSLGSAYLSLGIGNAIAGVVIAILKSAIVLLLFMGLVRASAMIRIVAATALCTWLLLVALSGVDYATRPHEPAAFQLPRQLPSFGPQPVQR
jgi:cytochrome c oxidase subunit IV